MRTGFICRSPFSPGIASSVCPSSEKLSSSNISNIGIVRSARMSIQVYEEHCMNKPGVIGQNYLKDTTPR